MIHKIVFFINRIVENIYSVCESFGVQFDWKIFKIAIPV